MKKLMTLMLGAAIAFGCVSAFAQEKKEPTKKSTGKNKKNTKKEDKR